MNELVAVINTSNLQAAANGQLRLCIELFLKAAPRITCSSQNDISPDLHWQITDIAVPEIKLDMVSFEVRIDNLGSKSEP